MQIILALAVMIAGISALFLGAPRLWFVDAVLIFAVIPFTLIVIMPTNKNLLDPGLDRASEVAYQLLRDWEDWTRFGAFLLSGLSKISRGMASYDSSA